MKIIIIGFSRPKKFKLFAWLIMKAYGIDYDHAYIKFYSESLDRDIIYQASKFMINFMGTKVFNDENIVTEEFKIPISKENYMALMQFAIDNAGKPYSIKEAFGLGIVRLYKLFGKNIDNPFREGPSVCSTLADFIIENFADVDMPGNYQDTSPKDLCDYLRSKYGQVN